jgi:hypothetical protein
MRSPRSNQTRERPLSSSRRHRRRLVVAGIGAVAFTLASAVVVAALAGHSSTGAQPEELSAPVQTPTEIAITPVASTGSGDRPSPSPTVAPGPAPDPTALADGTYPAHVRSVDVGAASITVDLIQIFTGEDAVDAATEDGVSGKDAEQYLYYPVYVRNENPLLRSFPVAGEVTIEFIGECESTGNRTAALQELSERTTPFDPNYYYSITLQGGVVERVVQHITVPAC